MKTIGQRLNEPGGIASRLRALRVEASLSGKDLAQAIGWAPSKVTKIELGQQAPKVTEIEAWVSACGADPTVALELVASLRALHAEHQSWQRRYRQGQAVAQAAYNRIIAEASVIRFFETWTVPGLLQTPLYARRMLNEAMHLSGLELDDVDAAVMVRMQRQQALYDLSKRFEFLLAEPVLHWRTCPPEIMRPQLDRLQTVIGLPNVRFGIFPYQAARKIGPQNSFCITDDLVSVETFVGEITYRGEDAQRYGEVLDALWANAIEGEAARAIIATAVQA